MTLFALRKHIRSILETARPETAAAETDMLLCAFFDIDRVELLAEGSRSVTEAEETAAEGLARRRAAGEPLQYVTGRAPFMGREFTVTPDVLIPRFDTEILCSTALEKLRELKADVPDRKVQVLDLCTGSGILAVTLGLDAPETVVTAADISPRALEVAAQNAEKLGAKNVEFVLSDLFEQLKDRKFDIIVSNPPYISDAEMRELPAEVGSYEPGLALRGGTDGLDFYRQISAQAGEHLTANGFLAFEIGLTQGEAVRTLMEQAGFVNVRVIQDMEGRDRVVCGTLA